MTARERSPLIDHIPPTTPYREPTPRDPAPTPDPCGSAVLWLGKISLGVGFVPAVLLLLSHYWSRDRDAITRARGVMLGTWVKPAVGSAVLLALVVVMASAVVRGRGDAACRDRANRAMNLAIDGSIAAIFGTLVVLVAVFMDGLSRSSWRY